MKLIKKTTIMKNKNSYVTTFPISMIEMLELEKGDTVKWELEIKDNKPTITISPE